MSNPGQKNKVTDIKKTSTLENKHRLKLKEFEILFFSKLNVIK